MCTTQSRSKLPLITTYQGDFTHTLGHEPPLPFCQEPCLYRREDQLNPRCFPISLPVFPHRERDSHIPIACGFETDIHTALYNEHNDKKKKKSKNASQNSTRPESNVSDSPSHTSRTSSTKGTPDKSYFDADYKHSVPQVILEELQKFYTYTPSSDMRDISITPKPKAPEPVSTIPKVPANPVRFRQQVKHARPEAWQKVGVIWDKCQERNGFNDSKSILESNTKTEGNRLLSRPRMQHQQPKKVTGQEKPQKESFNSHIPGYGGYKPQLPIKHWTDSFSAIGTTTSQTYCRKHPRISYRLPQYGHKGPMSRLVTLTEPFNPFNKISNQRVTVK